MAQIRPAEPGDLEALRAVERDAGRLFLVAGMPEIAAADPPSVAELERFRADGRAWVVTGAIGAPIAYLLDAIVDGCAHVHQVSVAGAHARQGFGAALIDHLAARARADGRCAVTLTTFRDMPWNAPYYRRLGFATFAPADHGPELTALLAAEATAIPGDAPRVAMRRSLKTSLTGLDHVQVAAPAGCEGEARRYYGALLGLRELEKPPALRGRGGVWFSLGPQQLHVGVDDRFVAASKAHPAFVVAPDALDGLASRLLAAGAVVEWDDALAGTRRFYSRDPWDNRVELVEAKAGDRATASSCRFSAPGPTNRQLGADQELPDARELPD